MITNKKKILYLSIIVTLPITILFLLLIFEVTENYLKQDKYAQNSPKGLRLSETIDSVYYDMKYKTSNLLGIRKKSDVNLIISKKHIKELYKNLPLSGNSYKNNSLIIIDNEIFIGKAKLRGDFFYHWAFPRKSWRFKTSKENLYNNTRKLNFIIPKHESLLSNHMSYILAKNLKLLAPKSRLVDFSINGVYNGVRLMVEQIDENFLRNNNRMPNDIYKGDNIGQKEFIGVEVSIFENAGIWEKPAFNNHYEEENKYPLYHFLKNLNNESLEHIDIKSFAAMSVLIDLSSSYHYDNRHNWLLYYDQYLEKTLPIIWDTNGWFPKNVDRKNLNIITSNLFDSLYHNYDFLREKYRVLKDFYLNHENEFVDSLKLNSEQARGFIKRNSHSFSLLRLLLNKKDALKSINDFEKSIMKQLHYTKNYFEGDVSPKKYKYALMKDKVRLLISDSKLINAIILKFKNDINAKEFKISYIQSGKKVSQSLNDRIKINDNEVVISVKLFAKLQFSSIFKGTNINFQDMTYDIDLESINTNDIIDVSLKFDNHNQETVRIDRVSMIDQVSIEEKILNVIPKNPIYKTLRWSGDKYIDKFTTIKDNIVIEKGTKIYLNEGATLKILGKIIAIGTNQEPILFDALDSKKPWGSIALIGNRANESIFKHVIFKNGSGDKGKLHEYTAMLSVHNVQNLVIENCEFLDSKLTDDMVHLVYSDAKIKHSKFIRSLSDALDVDMSNIIIEDCDFVNSGNDSIDLMTANAIIINSQFGYSTDKGISIGEGSNLLAINNVLEHNEIGVQSKDTSKAYFYNTSFIGNNKATDAYHKNWRYSDGGTIHIDNCIMQENIHNATVDKKSKIVINNCQIDSGNNFDNKSLRKGKIVLSDEQTIKVDFEQPFFDQYHDLIHPEKQGAYD